MSRWRRPAGPTPRQQRRQALPMPVGQRTPCRLRHFECSRDPGTIARLQTRMVEQLKAGGVLDVVARDHGRAGHGAKQRGQHPHRGLERVAEAVAEGVKSCPSVLDLARRHGVEMPICEVVYRVLHEDLPARVAVEELLRREPGSELR